MRRAAAALTLAALALGSAPMLGAASGAPGSPPPVPPSFGCTAQKQPTVTPSIPVDSAPDQASMNCFAWQEFIGLNWPADPSTCAADPNAGPSSFGDPKSTAPVVWETYKERDEVFLPGAKQPPGWCQTSTGATKAGRRRPKVLEDISKFSDVPPLNLSGFNQASPSNSWLTAQSGLLTMYEERMNQDEFNYVDHNGLYNAVTQQNFVQNPGINLPDGTPQFLSYGKVGSIELKAAWIELDDPSLWPRYKTSVATIEYPGQQPKQVTVGLVGLHIIHKTEHGQQFIWATFEHVDNAPSITDVNQHTLKASYTFFNPDCNPATDHYMCKQNVAPAPPGDPYSAPVQVVRLNPLDTRMTNNIVGLNEAVWQEIQAANPSSVYLNYQLVNVLWPNANMTIPPGSRVPLPQGNPQPPETQEAVVNTTLETYVQYDTCLDCHQSAPIASTTTRRSLLIRKVLAKGVPKPVAGAPYASDYSFMLMHAQVPGSRSGGLAGGLVALMVAGALGLAGAAVVRRRRARAG